MKTIGWLISSSGFSDQEMARRTGQLVRHLRDGFEVKIIVPPDSPPFLDSPEALATSDAAIKNFLAGEDSAVAAAYVLAGAIDPGLDQARAVSRRPVVGPFESNLLFAKIRKLKLGILSSDPLIAGATRGLIERLHAREQVASVTDIGFPVREIVNAIAAGDPDVEVDVQRRLIDGAHEAKAAGANAIYFGSMTLGTVGAEQLISAEVGINVINPAAVALAVAMDVAGQEGAQ